MTEAQKQSLTQMEGYRLVSRLHTGALIVVFAQKYHDAQAIDLEGRVWPLINYLAVIDHGTSPPSGQRA
jgi:hypothetical protein